MESFVIIKNNPQLSISTHLIITYYDAIENSVAS